MPIQLNGYIRLEPALSYVVGDVRRMSVDTGATGEIVKKLVMKLVIESPIKLNWSCKHVDMLNISAEGLGRLF